MWTDLFRKLSHSKVLPFIGFMPLILIPLAVVFGGDAMRGIGISIFFASMFCGIYLGQFVARRIAVHFEIASEELSRRITAACSVFGFLFLPAVWKVFSNSYLGTEMGGPSFITHLFWASGCAGLGFVATPASPKD